VNIFHNTGAALLPSNSYTVQGGTIGAITTADFNGDGKLDLMVFGTDTSGNWNYSVLLGNGDGSFQTPAYYPQSVQSGGNQVVVADFNNDGKLDIAIGVGNQTLAVLLGNGDGTFAAATYWYDAGVGPAGSADFNGDGKLDLLAGNGILYGNGDGTFQALVFPPSLEYFVGQFVTDLNNDGKADLVSGGGQVALGNGDGTFLVLPPKTDYDNYGDFVDAVADINGDGIPDLIGGYWVADLTPEPHNTGVMLGNGDGTFTALIDVPTTGYLPIYGFSNSTLVLIADMNDDGLPDILYYARGIDVLLNTTPTGQPDFKISATGLSPTPVTVGSATTSTIVVSPLNGFNGNVTLSCLGPSGTTCSLSSTTISGGSGTSILTFTPSCCPDMYPITVTGVSGNISRSAALTLIVDATSPDFEISASSPSPATVAPGNSATSTVSVAAVNAFNSAVSLACTVANLSGLTCSLSPSSVTPSGSSSAPATLTINAAAGAALGSQIIEIYGTSGSTVYGTGVVVNVAPDFSVTSAPGSPTSQTITAGQTANFSLALAPAGSFSGTVDLSCAITPVVTPAPTCGLSSSSVQLTGTGTQTVTVSVATTAPVTTGAVPPINFPPGTVPLTWSFILLGSIWLWVRNRKRLTALGAPIVVLALALLVSCGGSGSSSTHTTPGTPSGTYAVTITATSGSISNNVAPQVVVQ
jgi:hypothetical protein